MNKHRYNTTARINDNLEQHHHNLRNADIVDAILIGLLLVATLFVIL